MLQKSKSPKKKQQLCVYDYVCPPGHRKSQETKCHVELVIFDYAAGKPHDDAPFQRPVTWFHRRLQEIKEPGFVSGSADF